MNITNTNVFDTANANVPIQSWTVQCLPVDSRCKYWAKVIRADKALPMPETVTRAYDLPGAFALPGEEELFPGDVMIEGEAVHHRNNRGMCYTVYAVSIDGKKFMRNAGWAEFKAAIKAYGGFDPHLLKGSGDLAACVRYAHMIRLGIWPAANPQQRSAGA